MQEINIQGIQYSIVDKKERITIADSFVLPSNKMGGGNGEAKLYVGQNDSTLRSFFGERGFKVDCFLLKEDLLRFMSEIRTEYFEPFQNYREKESLPKLWLQRLNKVKELPERIDFKFIDQDQIAGPRVYVNSDGAGYKLIRELALPVVSYLDILKLQNNSTFKYYLKLNVVDSDITIEKEVENEVEFKMPFDPNKIKVRTIPSTIGQIIQDLEDKIINLDTEFQRHPNLWDEKKQSRFIESLLLRLPIPAFYFNEREENSLEVIDGLQRISTIKNFAIDKSLILRDLEYLKEYNNFSFDQLPNLYSRRIKTFPIITYVIEKDTPDEVKFNIFKRVNTGGLVLTQQEIRHAINQGTPSELVAELVRSKSEEIDDNETVIELKATPEGIAFKEATGDKIGSFRMEDRDFATRFVSFYLIPYTEYEPDLDTFLNRGMSKIRDLSKYEIDELKNNFREAMNLAKDIFGDDAFRKRFNLSDSRKPINKALFEVLSVNFAKLSQNERNILRLRKDIFKKYLMELHNRQDGKFLRSITQGTAQKESVDQRFRDIEKIIKQTLEND